MVTIISLGLFHGEWKARIFPLAKIHGKKEEPRENSRNMVTYQEDWDASNFMIRSVQSKPGKAKETKKTMRYAAYKRKPN